MDDLHSDSGDIAIRCPGCGQRFKVGPDLRGRMVECGSCDQRFRVDDDVEVRQRKVYPGERRNASLDQFSRVPTKTAVSPAFQPIHYETEPPAPAAVEPTSPLRILLGIAGVGAALLVAAILIFGGQPGNVLDGASTGKRLILSSFTAILSFVMLVAANPHNRAKGGLVGLVIALGLVALPFLFREGTTKVESPIGTEAVPFERREEAPVVEDPFQALKDEMHYEPVAEALAAYGPSFSSEGNTAVGVWLRDLRDYNKLQVRDYLTRETGASSASWLYPRPPNDFLMVLVDVENDLEKVAKACSRFGTVKRIIEEIQVIEVGVENEYFVQGASEKLTDPEHPSFYQLNRRELESIDLRRVGEAVKRFASVEPKVFRKDIVERMQELLPSAELEMQTDIATALSTWAEDGDGSTDVVRAVSEELMEKNGEVPRSMISFLVEQRDQAVIPLLDKMWAEDPSSWEVLYGEMGPPIEDRVLKQFEEGSATLKISAASLLSKVGTSKSLPILRTASEGARSEMAVVVGRAIKEIESRN